jgi:phenylpropionate dioxygenase-like ring-hydroxylating dioxygenase large terminal subunit
MPATPAAAAIALLNLQGDSGELHETIDAGFLLPTRWYSDPAIFQTELTRIHRRVWHFATHTDDLKEPGDVHVRNVAGVPIVLVRGADQEIRGFINICRQRGRPVVMEAGNKAKLRCHIHAWTYGLDGTLQQAPRSAGDPTFDPAEFSLVAIQTHVWGPMIWANLDLAAPSFDEWVSEMPQLLAERGLNVDEHAFGFDNTWAIDSNWKVFPDNTIECYHCPTPHPELARVLEMRPDLQKIRVGGKYWIDHSIPFRSNFEGSLTTKKQPGCRSTTTITGCSHRPICSTPDAASILAVSTSSRSTRFVSATFVSCRAVCRRTDSRAAKSSSRQMRRFARTWISAIGFKWVMPAGWPRRTACCASRSFCLRNSIT